MVQHYELMVAFPGTMLEDKLAEAKQSVISYITENGTITSQYDMQRRRLAYPIKQQHYGFYHVVQFDMEAAKVKIFNNNLTLNSSIMRYLLVKAKPLTEEQLRTMLTVEEKNQNQKMSYPIKDTAVKTAPVVEQSFEPVVTEKKTAVSMEELDKKLDAILDDQDIAMKL